MKLILLKKDSQLKVITITHRPIRRWEIFQRTNEDSEKKRREKAGDQVAVGSSFASDWLKWWRVFFLDQSQSVVTRDEPIKTNINNASFLIVT